MSNAQWQATMISVMDSKAMPPQPQMLLVSVALNQVGASAGAAGQPDCVALAQTCCTTHDLTTPTCPTVQIHMQYVVTAWNLSVGTTARR